MDSVYFRSALVQAPVILGRQLKPFSVYHALVLMQFDNAYMVGGLPAREDFLAGILICCEGYEDNLKTFSLFERSRTYRFFWGLRLLFSNLEKAQADFDEYIRVFTDAPSYWSGTDTKCSKVPWPFFLATVLLMYLPAFSPQQIWDMPLCLAACYKSVIAEENGAQLADQDIADMEKAAAKEEVSNGGSKNQDKT